MAACGPRSAGTLAVGIGKLGLDAIYNRDYPLIQGVMLFSGLVFTLLNFGADLAYFWIDPRVRRQLRRSPTDAPPKAAPAAWGRGDRVLWRLARRRSDANERHPARRAEHDPAEKVPASRVLFRQVMPRTLAPVVIVVTLDVGTLILAVAGLSFLGLGAQPPTPEWGTMINEGKNLLFTAPHVMLVPGAAVTITVAGFNLIGDALHDAAGVDAVRAPWL